MSQVPTRDVRTSHIEYLRHGETPMLAQVCEPDGDGPFPLLVDVHGGAWTSYDRTHRRATKQALARKGVVIISVDFRMPPLATYPASLADVNYAVRWAKANSELFKSRPEWVGLMGESSGGHQAVLAAMRPADPRYSGLQSRPAWDGIDATVMCVVALWPVISPLRRFQYAVQMRSEGKLKRMTDMTIPGHESFWLTEHAMDEGDPVRILERGEAVHLPPVIAVQGSSDISHPISHLERFGELYRAAGGWFDLEVVTMEPGVNLGVSIDEGPNDVTGERVLTRVAELVRRSAAETASA